MKAILLFLCLASAALGDEPDSPQSKVDWMFRFPEDQPFSFQTLYGSQEAFATLKAPERVEVYRIDPLAPMEPERGIKMILGHPLLSGPVVPPAPVRAELTALFTARDTFRDPPLCGSEPGILLRASSGKVTIDLLFCFKCSDVEIVRNDKRLAESKFNLRRADNQDYQDIKVSMTPASTLKFLRLFQSLFPDDKELQAVKPE